MTLTQLETAILRTALDAENSYFYAMKHDERITDTVYNMWRDDFILWEDEYTNGTLYLHGQSEPLSGIGQFPVPPSR